MISTTQIKALQAVAKAAKAFKDAAESDFAEGWWNRMWNSRDVLFAALDEWEAVK